MRTLDSWLKEYGESHQHPTNKQVHYLCVPVIFFSVLGILWSLPGPIPWIAPVIAGAMLFYFMLDIQLAVVMLAIILTCCGLLYWMEQQGLPVLYLCLGMFVIAWIGQFVGHKIEGKKPSFLTDLAFLLIGPFWILHRVLRRPNI